MTKGTAMIWFVEEISEGRFAFSYIIRADTEDEARGYADGHFDHDHIDWTDPNQATCVPASDDVVEGLMLREGHNGVVLHG